MEGFFFLVLVILIIVLITRAGVEEVEKAKKQVRNKEFKLKKSVFEDQEVEMADKYEKYVLEMVEKHKFALLADRKKLVTKDSYGVSQDNGWVTSKGKKLTGIDYFDTIVLIPELNEKFKNKIFPIKGYFNNRKEEEYFNTATEWATYCFCKHKLGNQKSYSSYVADEWRTNLINRKCDEIDNQDNFDSQNTDSMNGIEYEEYCKKILEDAGWEVEDTPTSGDQGVDLIASIEDVRVCIQCKCFAKTVGNKAVQEVAAGMIYWKGTHAVVVAKNGFTKSANNLAESTNVILTSDKELADLEDLVL